MDSKKHEYSEAKQKLLIDILMSSEEVFIRCQNILKPQYWNQKFRKAIKYILDYVDDHKALPKIQQLNVETQSNFELIPDINTHHIEAFLQEIEEFCKNRALAEAVLSAVDLIEKGNYGEVEKRVRDAILISLVSDVGTDYFADPRERLNRIKSNNGQVSTGWKTVDQKLYGGVNRGEITIWAAPSGVGKSLFLQNLSLSFVKQKLNVIYISLELSEELTSMRVDSMLTGVATTDIFRKLDDVEIKVKQTSRSSGTFHIKQMPQGSTTNDIKAYLKAYEIKTGQRADALIVDYLDLLYPNNKKINPSDLFIKDKFVAEELRGLAVERKILCMTASQLNRCLTLDTLVVRNGKRIPIDQLNVGDYIENEAGPVRVTEILPIVKQAVFEITTKSGKTIKVSSKHLFPTEDGLKNLESGLQVGDKLRSRLHK
jgi:replicative DNA helicase